MSAKVLVVDDTPMNVKMLADVLTFKGYQVVTAAGGSEGLAKVEEGQPGGAQRRAERFAVHRR